MVHEDCCSRVSEVILQIDNLLQKPTEESEAVLTKGEHRPLPLKGMGGLVSYTLPASGSLTGAEKVALEYSLRDEAE